MTFANNLDLDEAPQNVGPHLRSKFFDVQIICISKILDENYEFWQNFEEKTILSMYRVIIVSSAEVLNII